MSTELQTQGGGAKRQAAQDRCDAMVHYARQQIVERGLDGFSVNAVLRLSGGSKATLAKYFGGKNGLVAAAIRQEAEQAIAGLELVRNSALPVQQALHDALCGILRFYCAPGSLALYRAVIASADPEGSIGFYDSGHVVIRDALAGIMEARKGQAIAASINTSDVADQMLHAIRAGFYEKLLIGIGGEEVAASAIERRVTETLRLFLPAIQPAKKD